MPGVPVTPKGPVAAAKPKARIQASKGVATHPKPARRGAIATAALSKAPSVPTQVDAKTPFSVSRTDDSSTRQAPRAPVGANLSATATSSLKGSSRAATTGHGEACARIAGVTTSSGSAPGLIAPSRSSLKVSCGHRRRALAPRVAAARRRVQAQALRQSPRPSAAARSSSRRTGEQRRACSNSGGAAQTVYLETAAGAAGRLEASHSRRLEDSGGIARLAVR